MRKPLDATEGLSEQPTSASGQLFAGILAQPLCQVKSGFLFLPSF